MGGKKHISPVKAAPVFDGPFSTDELTRPETSTDEFRMFHFKITPCPKTTAHDWRACPFSHPTENARRRDPRKFVYGAEPCPNYKQGYCADGDLCQYSHGVYEAWLHPTKYRTELCKCGATCTRPLCFFAHSPAQLRHDVDLLASDTKDVADITPAGSPYLLLPGTPDSQALKAGPRMSNAYARRHGLEAQVVRLGRKNNASPMTPQKAKGTKPVPGKVAREADQLLRAADKLHKADQVRHTGQQQDMRTAGNAAWFQALPILHKQADQNQLPNPPARHAGDLIKAAASARGDGLQCQLAARAVAHPLGRSPTRAATPKQQQLHEGDQVIGSPQRQQGHSPAGMLLGQHQKHVLRASPSPQKERQSWSPFKSNLLGPAMLRTASMEASVDLDPDLAVQPQSWQVGLFQPKWILDVWDVLSGAGLS